MSGLLKKMIKKTYLLPIGVSLFFVPVFWNPSFVYAFTQGKEILFKGLMLMTVVGLSLALMTKKRLHFKNFFESKLFFLLLSLAAVFAFTDALSDHPLVTLYGTFSRGFGLIMEGFFLFFTLYVGLFVKKEDISKLIKLSFFSGVLVGLFALLQKIGFDPFFNHFNTNIFAGRVFSFLGNPSYLGQFMLLMVLMGGFLIISAKKWKEKGFYFIGSLIVLSAMLFSETRTAILGLFLSLILILIKYHKQFLKQLKKYWIPFVASIVLLGVIITKVDHGRYSLSEMGLRSLNSRFEIWQGTIDLIRSQPLQGYGGETFYIYFPEIATKAFFELEENINLAADRVHNELLEIFFSHGLFAVTLYLILLGWVLKLFFTSQNKIIALLSLIILVNAFQNQLSFPETSISILIAFCFGGLIAIELENSKIYSWKHWFRYMVGIAALCFVLYATVFTIYKPYRSQLTYNQSKNYYSLDYSKAVHKHKEALNYTPYYSELWYELMLIDPSSMKKALLYLEEIEGESGNVLAWKGNFYAKSNPAEASRFYLQALQKNPYHPNWIRAFADMLYKQGDFQSALFLYYRYLEAIPDFWKWTTNLETRSLKEQKSYRAFLKQTPDFWEVLKKIDFLNIKLKVE